MEHLLAKEGVAGSIPVSRSQKLNSLFYLREWLSGGAPPCQGGGRGFDPRLALYRKDKTGVKAEKLWHRLLSLCLTAHVTNG